MALAEGLKAAELDHMEAGIGQLARVIEMQGDLGVPLNTGHRVDRDCANHGAAP